MRGILMAVAVGLLLLFGCTDADVPATDGTGTSVPADSPAASAPPSGDHEGWEPSAEVTGPEAGEGIDLHGGVRTADFLKMPEQIGDLRKTGQESSTPEHRAVIEYEAVDKARKTQVTAYFPKVAGEARPIGSVDSAVYREVLTNVEQYYGDDYGKNPAKESVSAGGVDWDCFYLTRDQDYSLCLSVMYGRVLEVQHIASIAADVTERQRVADKDVTAMAEAIAILG